jgi:hypothetical protein
MNNIGFDVSFSLTYSSLIKAKILCGLTIVLVQSEWLTDREHIYKIPPNTIEDIPVCLCHPDVADRVKEACKLGNIEVIDYKDYLREKNKESE